jgi:hypothetical protein
MYSARISIDGYKSDVAVAVYQGENAEEAGQLFIVLRFLIACFSSGRRIWRNIRLFGEYYCARITRRLIRTVSHPNLMQLYGAASVSGLHAAVFNDGPSHRALARAVAEYPLIRPHSFRTIPRLLSHLTCVDCVTVYVHATQFALVRVSIHFRIRSTK